ncbi:hypothetical protein JT359_09020 [Candidatus Poribacteria bacterium]|nr:hypothetical protein [Candidatus Poribacteria bacterium]
MKQSYEVSLGSGWTEEQANRLLVTFDFIYQDSEEPNPNLNPSVWKISNTDLQEDFKIESADNLDHITLRSDIFSIQESHEENAQETILSNQPFFRVVAQFVTEDWTNISVVKQILKDGTDRDRIVLVLKEMYGLSLVRKDTPEANKIGQKLQKYIGELRLSKFKNQELVELMSVYEKFPKGLHKIPKLKYLIRSPQAPYAGSAWIVADCVEYAAATFSIKNENEFQRVILHEKAHFLWEYALNGKLRKEWSDLGGWHKDPNNKFGWAKTKSRREFVTNYAFSKNPNEDWAESVSYYLLHPNKLRSASLDKYEFIELVMLQYTDGDVPFKRLKTLTSTD